MICCFFFFITIDFHSSLKSGPSTKYSLGEYFFSIFFCLFEAMSTKALLCVFNMVQSLSMPNFKALDTIVLINGHTKSKMASARLGFFSHHHHQVPDLEQTLATMPLQTSLSSDNFKKFKPLLCPPVAELQRLSRNVIRCLPLSRLPSTLPVKDKNSKPLRLHTCPKNSICLFLIVFNSDL